MSVTKAPTRPITGLTWLAAAALLGCAGCGSGHPPVYPVRGKVLVDDKPAARAVVFFHPLGADGAPELGTEVRRPFAIVNPDGSFQLTTYQANDGAPAGKYAVTIVWRTVSKFSDDNEQDLLPRRYLSPGTSKLSAEVQEGETELPDFRLTRR
jgi:hypothetical protein